jgi:two-component system, OmpR family, response regulator
VGANDEVNDIFQDDTADAGGSRKRRKIIVVDDSEPVLSATSEILKRAGYRVLTRSGASGCVATILQEKPDLVLIDVGMPAVSGDTIVKLLLSAAPNSKTILLLFSGMDEDQLRTKAKACGAHGYITKTYNPAVLLRTLNRWLPRPLIGAQAGIPDLSTPPKSSNDIRISGVVRSSDEATAGDPGKGSGETRGRPPMRTAGEMRMPPGLVAVSSEIRVPREPALVTSFNAEGPRVLFLDDDMMVLSGYRRQLHGQPFIFEFALSGNEALRRLTSHDPPNLVVADLIMPEPGGAEVFRRAVEHDSAWNRRFVVVTGLPRPDAKKRLDSRFSGFLFQKPVMSEELSSAIRECLGLSAPASITRNAGAL